MKEEFKTLKFTPFVYLVKVGPDNATSPKIQPQTTRLSTVDKSSIILTFAHGVMNKGECYQMVFDVRTLGVRYDENTMKEQNTICTSKCACNTKGMVDCNEDVGVCICHDPFTGPDCG